MKKGSLISARADRRRGSILAVALFVVVLASFSAVMMATTMRDHQRMDNRKRNFNRAFYAGEAGIRSVVRWSNYEAAYTPNVNLFKYVSPSDYFIETGFISAKDGRLHLQYPNLYAAVLNGPYKITAATLKQMNLGSLKGAIDLTKSKDVEMATLDHITLCMPKAGDPNYDAADPTHPYGVNVYGVGKSRNGVQRTVLAYLTLYPNLNVALGGALISMAGAGLGGNATVHWGESWGRGDITDLPALNNLIHLDEKDTTFDKWARYRAEGKISGSGMALTYLGGSGNWASKWAAVVPANFNSGTSPFLFDDRLRSPIKGDIKQPGWFPPSNGAKQPASPPMISPSTPLAQNQQPAANFADGRMTNAFFQNIPANTIQFPDFLHQHRSSLDFKTYNLFKTFAINNGTYFTSDLNGNVLKDGAVVDFSTFQQTGSPEAKLYFVDTIDGNPPAANGSNLGNIKISGSSNGYMGLFYLCANVDVNGAGNTNYAPPGVHRPDGTTNISGKDSTNLNRVWLNGALFTAGSLSSTGNPIVYGTVVTEKGMVGGGTMDIYYNIDNRNGLKISGDNVPDRFTIVRQNNVATLPSGY